MADETMVNEVSGSEDLEQVKSRVVKLESLLTQKDEELAKTNTRLSEMEKAVAESDQVLSQAVSSYRALVVKAYPEVLEELLVGNTIDDVNTSLEKAKALVERVKQGLKTETVSVKVPAGAPERKGVNLEILSPREKIQYAIGGRK